MSTKYSFNEDDLLNGIAEGNKQTFDLIFNLFYKPLCLFAFHLVHNQHITEDVVQETLIKVWQRKDQFENMAKLKSFLYVTVRNACFDELEKVKVKQKHQDLIQFNETINEQTVLQAIISAEVANTIFKMVDTLPQQCRNVIRMTYVEGKKPKEIAEQLGINVSTVNSQKMRGILLLKDKLPDKEFLTALIFLFSDIWF